MATEIAIILVMVGLLNCTFCFVVNSSQFCLLISLVTTHCQHSESLHDFSCRFCNYSLNIIMFIKYSLYLTCCLLFSGLTCVFRVIKL